MEVSWSVCLYNLFLWGGFFNCLSEARKLNF